MTLCDRLNIQKRNEVLIGWSDDGFHWNREFKQPFLPVSDDAKAWNAGNVQSTAGNPLIVGDSLYFYVSGRYNSKPVHDSNFTTGLAALRRMTALYPCKPEPKKGILLLTRLPLTAIGYDFFFCFHKISLNLCSRKTGTII